MSKENELKMKEAVERVNDEAKNVVEKEVEIIGLTQNEASVVNLNIAKFKEIIGTYERHIDALENGQDGLEVLWAEKKREQLIRDTSTNTELKEQAQVRIKNLTTHIEHKERQYAEFERCVAQFTKIVENIERHIEIIDLPEKTIYTYDSKFFEFHIELMLLVNEIKVK